MSFYNSEIKVPPSRGTALSSISNKRKNLLNIIVDNINTASIFIPRQDVEKFKRFFFYVELTNNDFLFYCIHTGRKPKRNRIGKNYLGDYSIYLGLRYYKNLDAYMVFFLKSIPLKLFYIDKNIKDYKVLLKFD